MGGGGIQFGSSGGGVDVDLPGGLVDQGVVFAAEQDEVVEGCGAVVGPVGDVVGVAGDGEAGAAGEGAVLVAEDQGGPDAGGDQAAGAADVEDLALGAEDGGDDLGVAGQSAGGGGGEGVAGGEESVAGELVLQVVDAHGEGDPGGSAVGVGQGVGGLESAAGLDQGVPHPDAVVAGVLAVVGALGSGQPWRIDVLGRRTGSHRVAGSPPQAPGSVVTGVVRVIRQDLTSSASSRLA